MTTRRPRGTLRNPVGIHWVVEAEAKDLFDDMASKAQVSGAVFFERAVAHIQSELGQDGLPSWWPDAERPEELPINTA